MESSRPPIFDPTTVQHQIRQNSTDIQNFLSDLSNWSNEMKVKELAESSCDLTPLENVPVRSDPKKSKQQKIDKSSTGKPYSSAKEIKDIYEKTENETETEVKSNKKLTTCDYKGWEKFDAEKACEEVETTKSTHIDSEDDAVRRKAIEYRLRKMATEQKDLGNQCLKEKNYIKAIEYYTEGIRCDKKSAVLYANRAQAYIFLKQFVSAIDDCSQSIKNDSTYVKAYYRRAKAQFEVGRLNDAKNDLNQALKLEPTNTEAKNLLSEINRKTMQSLLGPGTKTAIPERMKSDRPSPFPGIKTVLGSRITNIQSALMDDDDGAQGDSVFVDTEKYPKQIVPIKKPTERRSKRPLLPIHVKVIGEEDTEKKMRLDFNGNEGNSNSSSVSNTSSGLSTPVALPSSPIACVTSSSAVSPQTTLPNLFSQLKMASIPNKPKTAAQFNLDWKKLKLYPDMSAQYLKQLDCEDDYLIFKDSMEYSILSDILDLLVWEFIPRNWEFLHHLQGLLKVRRFSTLVLFMTEKDRANARKLISECHEDIQDYLKTKFNV